MKILVILALVFGAAAASLGAASLDEYKASKEGEEPNVKRQDELVMTFFHDHKVPLVFVLTIGATWPGLVVAWVEGNRRQKDRKGAMIRSLQHIHKRSFGSTDNTGMDPGYRVSLFTPAHERKQRWKLWSRKRHVLRCLHRTDGKLPKCTWDLDGEHGLVVTAWRYQATFIVSPPSNTKGDSERYLKDAYMTSELRRQRSWPNAGMTATPIPSSGTEPLAILLVEANGREIAWSEVNWDAKVFAILLGEPQ